MGTNNGGAESGGCNYTSHWGEVWGGGPSPEKNIVCYETTSTIAIIITQPESR